MRTSSHRLPRRGHLVAAALLLLPGAALPGAAEDAASAFPRAFEFELEDINPKSPTHGKRVALRDLYADGGVVLNFVASWCPPCWIEAPMMERLHTEDGTPIIYVAADEHGPTEDLLRLAARAGLARPILHVPRDRIALMEQHYDHGMLPTTYVIDGKGRIRRVIQGMLPEEEMRAELLGFFPRAEADRR
jgi:thiol-disulfide isomerase/thioredoxin